jgi:hypothetical protein
MAIQIRRSTKDRFIAHGPFKEGELVYVTDEKLLYVGDDVDTYLVGRSAFSTEDPTGSGISGLLHVNISTSGIFLSDGSSWHLVGGVTQEWVTNQGYVYGYQLTTTSGDIINYIDNLPTGEVSYLQLVTTSGDLIAYINSELTTIDGGVF